MNNRYKFNFCAIFSSVFDVTKHRTVRTRPKYMSWVLVKCVWCSAYYWFPLRKGSGYGFHAFLTYILLLLLLIQCKISLYLGPVLPGRCFLTPVTLLYAECMRIKCVVFVSSMGVLIDMDVCGCSWNGHGSIFYCNWWITWQVLLLLMIIIIKSQVCNGA